LLRHPPAKTNTPTDIKYDLLFKTIILCIIYIYNLSSNKLCAVRRQHKYNSYNIFSALAVLLDAMSDSTPTSSLIDRVFSRVTVAR
jgi:hypothetical protein